MSKIIVHIEAEWMAPPDARGDRKVFPKGWTGEMDEDWAGYCIARGIARAVEPLSEALQTGIALLREIAKQLVEARIEPTYKTVYDAVGALAAAQERDPTTVPIPAADPAALTIEPIPNATGTAPVVPLVGDAAASAAAAAAASSAPTVTRRRTGARA